MPDLSNPTVTTDAATIEATQEEIASLRRVASERAAEVAALRAERDALREAARHLIDSIEATGCRDGIVIRDIAALRALASSERGAPPQGGES